MSFEVLTVNLVVMTDASVPEKKTKGELEQLVKANGGKIYQTNAVVPDTICIAERSTFSTVARHCSRLIHPRDGQSGFVAKGQADEHRQAILVD